MATFVKPTAGGDYRREDRHTMHTGIRDSGNAHVITRPLHYVNLAESPQQALPLVF